MFWFIRIYLLIIWLKTLLILPIDFDVINQSVNCHVFCQIVVLLIIKFTYKPPWLTLLLLMWLIICFILSSGTFFVSFTQSRDWVLYIFAHICMATKFEKWLMCWSFCSVTLLIHAAQKSFFFYKLTFYYNFQPCNLYLSMFKSWTATGTAM